MSQFIMDLFFATVFALLLILLVKIREKAFADNKESYRYTFLGILILGIVSLLQLAGHQSILNSIPFLSEPIYRELALAIGIVSGVALMIAGASIWLPGKKRPKNSHAKGYTQSLLVNNIGMTIIDSQDSKQLLSRIPKMIYREYGFASYAVFRLNNRQKRYECIGFEASDKTWQESIRTIDLSSINPNLQPDEIKSRVSHDYYLPIRSGKNIQALFMFRKHDNETVTNDERAELESITRLLSHRLNSDFIALKERFYSRCWEYFGHMRNILAVKNGISPNLSALYKLFNHAVGAEYLSIAVIGKKQGNPRIYTVGINGNVLLDGGNSAAMKNSHFKRIMEHRKPVIIGNINDIADDSHDTMFISCGQCNLMAQPLISDGRIIAILTLGHSVAGHFAKRDILLAEIMAYALMPAVECELFHQAVYERDRSLAALNSFESAIENSTDTESLLNAAADLILRNLETTMVRISLFDSTRTKLKTKALKMIRPLPDINTGEAIISKELTHWHRMVADKGRLLLINQQDPESCMEKSETETLMFRGMQSALVIPIVINGLTVGLITLGEMRRWDRSSYNSTAISFCKGIAARISDTIKLQRMSRMLITPTTDRNTCQIDKQSMNELRRRIRGPVTNLQGSLEMLKIKGLDAEGDANRILAKMQESSDDIVNMLNES